MPKMKAVVADGWYRFGQLVVCRTCQQLRGPWRKFHDREVWVQYCACGPAVVPGLADVRVGLWPGFDYNQAAELCRCCGLEVLSSGSRWSVWFCEHCKDWVRDLNAQAGACVIPIGRHSIMNGVALPATKAREPGAVHSFASDVLSLKKSQDWTATWAREVVKSNVAAIGLDPHDDVALPQYLELVDTYFLQKPIAVRRMFAAAGSGSEVE